MIIETDYTRKSGQGTAMFSRRGIFTIQNHKVFCKNQYDAPKIGEPEKTAIKAFDYERLS